MRPRHFAVLLPRAGACRLLRRRPCARSPADPDARPRPGPSPSRATPAPTRRSPWSPPTVPAALRTTRIPVYVERNHGPISEGCGLGGESRAVVRPAARRDDRGAHRAGRARSAASTATIPAPASPANCSASASIPAAMQVVVTYDAAIARGPSGGVATNRFEARVPVAAATPAAVAPALNQAANQVADQVAAWLGTGG